MRVLLAAVSLFVLAQRPIIVRALIIADAAVIARR